MKIKSYLGTYEVKFVDTLAACLKATHQHANPIAIIDQKVYELYKSTIDEHLNCPKILINAIEQNKSFEKVGDYIVELLNLGCKKTHHLIVIGGGIVQDIGGFIASILNRGLDWTLIPTTLLAQCDSCIGSKTSMNIAKFKNQLGTFYPPKQVLITSEVLKTLTEQEINSGLCEAIKLAMIVGDHELEKMEKQLSSTAEDKYLMIVQQALSLKKVFIEEDEFDKGRRNLLNFGHTFGHAFESASNYEIPHGIAIGWGIIAAHLLSIELGYISHKDSQKQINLLLPLVGCSQKSLTNLSANRIMECFKTDKKNEQNNIGFILTKGNGKIFISQQSKIIAQKFINWFIDAYPGIK